MEYTCGSHHFSLHTEVVPEPDEDSLADYYTSLSHSTMAQAMEPPEHQSAVAHLMDVHDQSKATVEFETAQKLIMRWDSTASEKARERMIFYGDRRSAGEYLRAVDEIRRSMERLSVSSTGSGGDPAMVTGAMQIAMARLEDEFRNILINHNHPIEDDEVLSDRNPSVPGSARAENASEFGDDGEEFREEEEEEQEGGRSSATYRSTSSNLEIEMVPQDAIDDLHSIADRMIAAGYGREVIQVYGSVRKSVIDASLRRLGVEKLSIGEVQRLEWNALEAKIRRWIRAARVSVRVIFASERRLCERIFHGLRSESGDTCFMETVKGAAIQLFDFAEAISISRRSPEKLFKILDLHDALSDLLPDVDAVFGSIESVRVQAAEILSRLAEAARGVLSEFENAVQRESSRIPVPRGTLHPLTRYVMNYISLISDYKQTLIELITAGPRLSSDQAVPETDILDAEDRLPLAKHLIWIILVLQSTLESKSKLYKDTALSHLFLMNNVHYIVQKAMGSPELRELIGDGYLKKLTAKYRQSATSYQRATWLHILYCLRDEGIHVSGAFSSGVSKTALKERFKAFNSAFEEAHRVQAAWLVPDPQLREELRISIAEKLLPAYRSFFGRFRHHLESGRHSEMYIKYSVEDLESAILDFFEGMPVSLHTRRISH